MVGGDLGGDGIDQRRSRARDRRRRRRPRWCGRCRAARVLQKCTRRSARAQDLARPARSGSPGRPGRGRRRRGAASPGRASGAPSSSPSALASALTAAAAMALPPRRPCTTTNGTRAVARERLLRFGRADEADRDADHGRRARRALVQHLEQAEQGGRRVADRDERRRRGARATAPSRRPCGWCRARAASAGHARIVERADHLVAGRQPRPGDRRSRPSWRRTGSARRPAAPLRRPRRSPATSPRRAGRSVMPQAWIMRTTTRSAAPAKRARSASARMIAKERR